MLSSKASKMKRQNRGTFVLDKQDGDTVKQWLPYGVSPSPPRRGPWTCPAGTPFPPHGAAPAMGARRKG